MSKKDLSWKIYDKNPGPGGAKVDLSKVDPKYYTDQSHVNKGKEHPRDTLNRVRTQGWSSGQKK